MRKRIGFGPANPNNKYFLSRCLRHGDVVTLISGNRVIRCSRQRKPFGVFQFEDTKRYILLDGSVVNIETPRGIQIRGMSSILMDYPAES